MAVGWVGAWSTVYPDVPGSAGGTLGAVARAVSTDHFGFAYATAFGGVVQTAYATGGGNAHAMLSQAGGIDVHVTALAGGSGAFASAQNAYGIYQRASATDGYASATIAIRR